MFRFIYSFFFLLAIFFLPWWFYLILGLIGILVFDNYYELGLVGFIYDLVFNLPGYGPFTSTQFNFCLVSLIVVLLVEEIKRRTVFYCNKDEYSNFYTTLGR